MTDQELISRVLKGEKNAFRELVERHKRLVSFMVGKIIRNAEEHEEICQDVFLKVYDKLSHFNFESKLSTWIGTIAYRHALNAFRKGRHEMVTLSEEDFTVTSFIDVNTPEKILCDDDMDSYVLALVEQLPTQYKIVINLYHVEGMQYDEIATITGMPSGTVKSYLFRARTLLKEKIKLLIEKDDEYEFRR